jgi:protein tyrosine phosphatase (PTP) superfamily phosphohydrolase (DUF442 family)
MNNPLESITNFLEVPPRLSTAGQPIAAQFSDIKNAGFEVVINLAMKDSPNAIPAEGELVENLGMHHIHIPVVWENPQPTDLDRFLSAMEQNKDKKVFVHCVLNMRVTAFVYLYRLIRLGEPQQEAMEMVNEIWEFDETWQAFTDRMLQEHHWQKR